MTELMGIQPFLQSYVLAIASILDAEVTVVDSRLIRVAGTGEYLHQMGKHVPNDCFFRQILEEDTPGIIEDVRESSVCGTCEKRQNCRELANLAYPIRLRGQVVGIIAIIAFETAQRTRLLAQRSKLEEFLKYMSDLLESKILTSEDNRQLAQQMREVIHEKKHSDFIGHSDSVEEIRRLVRRIGPSSSTVLITGESGVGKEIVAQMIHAAGPRQKRLMISINCGAIPEALLESELFGYERGAFTGAKREGHVGKFELAHGSTLFLDEIGDLPLSAQTKLLRVLQEQVVQRIGGSRTVPIDVRVICATNRDLAALVEDGRFRRDLFFRLNVIPLHLPPLRERREDIPPLADYWLEHYNREQKKNITAMEQPVYQALSGYHWPGNVRELKNLMEYLVNMVDGPVVHLADLPDHLLLKSENGWTGQSLSALLDDYEGKILAGLAPKYPSAKDKEALARSLHISRATLYRKLEKHRLALDGNPSQE